MEFDLCDSFDLQLYFVEILKYLVPFLRHRSLGSKSAVGSVITAFMQILSQVLTAGGSRRGVRSYSLSHFDLYYAIAIGTIKLLYYITLGIYNTRVGNIPKRIKLTRCHL